MDQDFSQLSRELVAVAVGNAPADLVIRNARWVCVQSGEIIPKTDIAIIGQRIAFVGSDASHTIQAQTEIIDADDRYVSPGLLDGHMHVESQMLTVSEFVRAVVAYGTTGVFIDPHEIANVFGLNGVRLMVDEAAIQPIHVWVQMPSCVPSAPGLETSGAVIGPDEVAEAMTWKGIIGLGEMMNFPGVIAGDPAMHAEMSITRSAGKVIGGHYASADLGVLFHGYVAGGPEDDHESLTMQDAVQRIRQGMKAMVRFGSSEHNVDEQVRAITELGLDARHFILCTDDCHAETLVEEGHVNRAVRRAIARGLSPIQAYQMATINTAEHFGVSRDVGQIAPGRYADLVIYKDFIGAIPAIVFAKGKIIAENGKPCITNAEFPYPDWSRRSVNIGRELSKEKFKIPIPQDLGHRSTVQANVIGIIENQVTTRHLKIEMAVSGQELFADVAHDIAKVAVIERHRGHGSVQLGLVKGFGFKSPCAVASTVAHDCHQLVVVGTAEEDMAIAANKLVQVGGGQIVVREQEVIALLELPIAGLMSDEPTHVIAGKAREIINGFQLCGCQISNPNMPLSFLALAVIPELRLSDKGLVDVNRFEFIPLVQ
jgi:adenine deaminase